MNSENNPQTVTIKKKTLLIILSVAVVGLIVAATLGYVMTHKEDPAQVQAREVQKVVGQVSKLLLLPTDETPTLATVTDPEKLRSQPFFANAKTGYKVLVYPKAQKAILYDPVANKIIDVAPLSIGANK